ncbi:MAG: 4Fe-4S dicluster domain-containing protein [Clostridia bacterium]|nr:4Fe-4S dicluster domain-containing protein [Clostridia bacterium]
MQEMMKKRAKELLASGEVTRVIGWKKNEFDYDITPAVFTSAEEIDRDFIYDDFCGVNLSKFTFQHQKNDTKTLVFLKPCDSYSMTQLITEHRVDRNALYIIGVPSYGKIDVEKIKADGVTGILSITSEGGDVHVHTLYGDKTYAKYEVTSERCLNCKSKMHPTYDELIGFEGEVMETERFDEVAKLEAMTPEERFEFWRGELSRCIRCNACRNACPACTCETCIFDNNDSGVAQKAAADSFEENMFHIIRAFHVAGRCTDCGECSRVCPQHIPLHLLNRKFISDINKFYGDYQAGAEIGQRAPLVNFTKEDVEPDIVAKGGKA